MTNSIQYLLQAKGLFPITAKTIQELAGPDCILKGGVEPQWSFTQIVVSDLARITPGSLFVPYQEADELCTQYVHKGALAVLTDHELKGLPTIVVPDLTAILIKLCSWMFEAIQLPSVVVAGSEGKTTTKRMICSILRIKNRVSSQFDNYNTLQALCCFLQRVKEDSTIIVQEVDEKRLQNTVNCSNILRPRIAVITNIAEAHLGFYRSKEALIGSFEGITSGMNSEGIVIINGDDPDSLRAEFDRRVIRVGILDQSCDCVAKEIHEDTGHTDFKLLYQGNQIHIRLKTIGEHNVYNAMMAYLVGKLSGMQDRDILRGLASFRNWGIRQNIICLGGITIYADCINASLRSISYALRCFCSLRIGKGKRVAILGDIAEIEGFEEDTYRQIAELLNRSSIDAFISCGTDIRLVGSFLSKEILWFHANNLQELNEILRQHKKEYRAFLFKASRFMELEKCILDVFPIHYRWIKRQERAARTRFNDR